MAGEPWPRAVSDQAWVGLSFESPLGLAEPTSPEPAGICPGGDELRWHLCHWGWWTLLGGWEGDPDGDASGQAPPPARQVPPGLFPAGASGAGGSAPGASLGTVSERLGNAASLL